MKKQGILGLVVGVTAGVAAAVAGGLATVKVVKEIKNDLKDVDFASPNGDNIVSLKFGSSEFAKGLSYVKVEAKIEDGEDSCDFVMLAGKNAGGLSCEWTDNEHCTVMLGEGRLKQRCDIDYTGEEIVISYYVYKVEDEAEECEDLVEVEAEECEEAACEEQPAEDENA